MNRLSHRSSSGPIGRAGTGLLIRIEIAGAEALELRDVEVTAP